MKRRRRRAWSTRAASRVSYRGPVRSIPACPLTLCFAAALSEPAFQPIPAPTLTRPVPSASPVLGPAQLRQSKEEIPLLAVSTADAAAALADPDHSGMRSSVDLSQAGLNTKCIPSTCDGNGAAKRPRLHKSQVLSSNPVVPDLSTTAQVVVALSRRVIEAPQEVRSVLQEIASSRTRTPRVAAEVHPRDIPRAVRLLLPGVAVSKAAAEYAELVLMLGPLDPKQQDAAAPVSAEALASAAVDAGAAVQLANSESPEDRRTLCGLLEGFAREAGRSQLRIQNGFRELGWNQAGEVTHRQAIQVLQAAVPAAGPAELRLVAALLEREDGGQGQHRITLDGLRALLRSVLEGAAAAPLGFQPPPPKSRKRKGPPTQAAASPPAATTRDSAVAPAPARPSSRASNGSRRSESVLEAIDSVQGTAALDALKAQFSQLRVSQQQQQVPPPALQGAQPTAAPMPPPTPPQAPAPVVQQHPAQPQQQQQQQVPQHLQQQLIQQWAPRGPLIPAAALDALIQRASGLRTAMDSALQQGATMQGPIAPAPAAQTELSVVDRLLRASQQRSTPPEALVPAAAAAASSVAPAPGALSAAPGEAEDADVDSSDDESVVEDALMSELFFPTSSRRAPMAEVAKALAAAHVERQPAPARPEAAAPAMRPRQETTPAPAPASGPAPASQPSADASEPMAPGLQLLVRVISTGLQAPVQGGRLEATLKVGARLRLSPTSTANPWHKPS